jgi:hypothetical protein
MPYRDPTVIKAELDGHRQTLEQASPRGHERHTVPHLIASLESELSHALACDAIATEIRREKREYAAISARARDQGVHEAYGPALGERAATVRSLESHYEDVAGESPHRRVRELISGELMAARTERAVLEERLGHTPTDAALAERHKAIHQTVASLEAEWRNTAGA